MQQGDRNLRRFLVALVLLGGCAAAPAARVGANNSHNWHSPRRSTTTTTAPKPSAPVTTTTAAPVATTAPTTAPPPPTTAAPATTTPPTAPPTTAAPPTTSAPVAGTIFYDGFDGSSLDLSKWQPNWLAGNDSTITKPINGAESSCYDPAQVSVSGGYLHLKAAARTCLASNGVTYNYASGLVNTRNDFTFTFGHLEARVWMPPGSGSAQNWGAFWADGTGTWPTTGELDVVEALNGKDCWHFHSTSGGPGGCASMASAGGWHTFAADWQSGRVTYFYDGTQVGQLTSGITSAPMFLILNLGLSSTIAPPITTPSEMLVDYVRVTQ